ncbi:MAG TPA: FkbM family methyltransferase [Pyrinomonadaceae bacterium]|mgnify:CR=1 FL=1|nr:FkbM family methyltransferase [Pyrinomonadaceae bacterium]
MKRADEPASMMQKLEEYWLRGVRFYTFNTPVKKGSYRLFTYALALCRHPHRSLRVDLKDGRKLWVNLTTGMQETVFFHGEFEVPITEITRQLVDVGDTCLDIGANYGWYTTLFASVVKDQGEVHSFEPVPVTFAELTRNRELMGSPANVKINNLALGDTPGTITLNFFEGEPTGHASIATKDTATSDSFECKMITLDSYLEENDIKTVDFVKVDIEGAELMMLRGARALFSGTKLPVILMEMALQQSSNFGYVPNDLIEFIRSNGDYEFFKVNELEHKLVKIEGFAPGDVGANVFCVPRDATERVRRVIEKYSK